MLVLTDRDTRTTEGYRQKRQDGVGGQIESPVVVKCCDSSGNSLLFHLLSTNVGVTVHASQLFPFL